MLKIFDTLQNSEIKIDLSVDKPINFYSCGPTVYNYAHIGNLRTFIMTDLLVRTLKANGHKVNWVMNLTDIDDKTITGTIAEFGSNANIQTLKTYTSRFAEKFISDLREVGIDTEQINFMNVTDVIPEVQEFIVSLLEKGYAYTAEDGSTYFSIEKYQADFKDYGALVGEKFLEGKQVGARIKNDEYDKDNLSDFALWKAWDESDGQIFWDHPTLGKGRPGWHIECSAINKVAFDGKTTDIHTGGVDLIFPHHTNEIAQSQPIVNPFVTYWVHFEHLLVDGKKMAKSLKNIYTIDDLKVKGFSGLDLRYLFMQSGFRQQSNFTWESLEAAKTSRNKLKSAYTDSKNYDDADFLATINENLNTSAGLAYAWNHKDNLSFFDTVFGLKLNEQESIDIPIEVQNLLDQRQTARDNKDFENSDRLRMEIENMGYEVKDTTDGQQITKR